MANINMYLTKILSAIYGEEVRGSIHDAIAAMNVESSQAMQDASIAQDSAMHSASSAAESALIASSAEESALSSKNDAESAKNIAESSAFTASSAAESALSSKNDAESAKSISESSASTAVQSASDALVSKNAAESAKNIAQSSASTASSAALTAQTAELNASRSSENVDAIVAGVMTGGVTLMVDHATYQELTDSSGNNLLDSTNGKLVGRVLFADAEDIISLKKNILDLEIIVNQLLALLLPSRLTSVETEIIELNGLIAELNEHALLDSTL